jgi:hypothetical protein
VAVAVEEAQAIRLPVERNPQAMRVSSRNMVLTISVDRWESVGDGGDHPGPVLLDPVVELDEGHRRRARRVAHSQVAPAAAPPKPMPPAIVTISVSRDMDGMANAANATTNATTAATMRATGTVRVRSGRVHWGGRGSRGRLALEWAIWSRWTSHNQSGEVAGVSQGSS